MGSAIPEVRTISPPNFISGLLQWRTLASLCSRLPDPGAVSSTHLPPSLDGTRPQQLPRLPMVKAVDSHFHFHLDCLLIRTGYPDLSFLLAAVPTSLRGVELDKVLAIYCFLSSWPTLAELHEIASDVRIKFSFGLHPRSTTNFRLAHVGRSPSSLLQDRFKQGRECTKKDDQTHTTD